VIHDYGSRYFINIHHEMISLIVQDSFIAEFKLHKTIINIYMHKRYKTLMITCILSHL